MSNTDKVLTYEEAKQLCEKAFDGGATYGSKSMLYGRDVAAYDWEHWLKENESLFRPKPTVEDVLRELLDAVEDDKAGQDRIIAECAARLSLAGEDE